MSDITELVTEVNELTTATTELTVEVVALKDRLAGDVSTATTKAEEAAASAASASAAADTAFALSKYAMTRVEFDARREQNKRKYKGSGWLEMGSTQNNPDNTINEGLHALANISQAANALYLGRRGESVGNSQTDEAIALVDGVQLHIEGTKSLLDSNFTNWAGHFSLAPSPDGTEVADSATGIVTKYATAAEAFDYNTINSNFRNGTANWTVFGGRGDFTVADGIATVTNSTTAGSPQYIQQNCATVGIPNILEIAIKSISGTGANVYVNANGSALKILDVTEPGLYSVEWTPTSNTLHVYVDDAGSGDSVAEFTYISVRESTQRVIDSRQDFSYLEVFYEDIADKDIGCPLGNTQWGQDTYGGIPLVKLSTTAIGQGYGAFGQWDSDSDPYVAVWSTLTDAQKIAFLQDPRNNIFYDAVTGKLIQARYRIKSLKGLGNNWSTVYQGQYSGDGYLCYKTSFEFDQLVNPQGILDTATGISSEDNGVLDTIHTGSTGSHTQSPLVAGQASLRDTASTFAYENKLAVLPICLTQRLNQGLYHPGLNPSGCGRYWRAKGILGSWYQSQDVLIAQSQQDCFDFHDYAEDSSHVGHPVSEEGVPIGRIGGSSGRADQYEYYDGVYAGLVQDLRLPARRVNPNLAREDLIRHSVAGVVRGKDGVPFIGSGVINSFVENYIANGRITISSPFVGTVDMCQAGGYANLNWGFVHLATGDFYRVVNRNTTNLTVVKWNGTSWDSTIDNTPLNGASLLFIPITAKHTNDNTKLGYVATETAAVNSGYADGLVVSNVFKLSAAFDSLPWCDISGTPANIGEVAKKLGGSIVGQWIPEIPDGTSKPFYFNSKYVGAPTMFYTSNDGSTWSYSDTPSGVDAVTNSRTKSSTATYVYLYNYETLSAFTEPADNSKVVGNVGDVVATSRNDTNAGNRICPSVLGLVLKDNGTSQRPRWLGVDGYEIYNDTLNTNDVLAPAHNAITLSAPVNDSKAFKALSTITEKDGLLYGQLHAQSMTHNGTDWGDSGTLPIVSGESTVTDLNGNVQKAVCHHTVFPIGIA